MQLTIQFNAVLPIDVHSAMGHSSSVYHTIRQLHHRSSTATRGGGGDPGNGGTQEADWETSL